MRYLYNQWQSPNTANHNFIQNYNQYLRLVLWFVMLSTSKEYSISYTLLVFLNSLSLSDAQKPVQRKILNSDLVNIQTRSP